MSRTPLIESDLSKMLAAEVGLATEELARNNVTLESGLATQAMRIRAADHLRHLRSTELYQKETDQEKKRQEEEAARRAEIEIREEKEKAEKKAKCLAAKKEASSFARLDKESIININEIMAGGYVGLDSNEALALNFKAANAVSDGIADNQPAIQNAAKTHDILEPYLLTPAEIKLSDKEKQEILITRTPEQIKWAEEQVKQTAANALTETPPAEKAKDLAAKQEIAKFSCKNGKCEIIYEAVSKYHDTHGYREKGEQDKLAEAGKGVEPTQKQPAEVDSVSPKALPANAPNNNQAILTN